MVETPRPIDPRTDIITPPRPVAWCGDSRERLREFSGDVRYEIGKQLNRVQGGLEPHDWKPMPSIGPGVREIRVQVQGQYRLIYLAKFADKVYVLHAFAKKTRRTAQRDMDLATTRLRKVLRERQIRPSNEGLP
jgi:phage-related protein